MTLSLLTTLTLLTTVGADPRVSVEHVGLDAVPKAVIVDSLGGRVTLVGVRDEHVWRASRQSRLCARAERLVDGAPLQLVCSSRRLVVDVRGRTLRIQTTLGPPVTADESAAPPSAYDPVRFDLGGPCPGDTLSARGECAVQQGRYIAAARALREVWEGQGMRSAATGPLLSHAALRLGDLAWLNGDVDSAARWYDLSGAGVFARIASARLCELATDCIDGPTDRLRFDTTDLGGLPDEVARELTLRRARALAFLDRLDDAVLLLLAALRSWPNLCDDALPLCRKIATEALLARHDRDAPEALALSLSLSRPFEGKGAVNLARAVLRHSDRLGAPLFGANVLAAVSSQVPRADLPMHLASTAAHYVDAKDGVRADIVIAYAAARDLDGHPRWRDLRRARRRIEASTSHPTHTNPSDPAP